VSDDAALTAFQLADSFLPTGTYSSSYALEQFVQDGRVETAEDLQGLLETYLRRQIGPAELVALRHAHRAATDDDLTALLDADRQLHATTLPAEFRESATRSGARLCDLWIETREEVPLLVEYRSADPPQQYPGVLGAVTASAGIGAERACLLHCYSFLSDMLGAAQRLLSLGHTEAQAIVEASKPVARAAVDDSEGRALADMTPFAPLVDVEAAAHERAQRRLFVS